jgi:4-amino-4-deoxy-L-arabinose transferase-like glycosyltransferase
LDQPQQNIPASSISRGSLPASFLSKTAMLGIIVLTWALTYLPGLATPGLLDDADSIHAEASREMLLNHNWVTLYVNGIRYLEKSPFMYWAVSVSYKLFGVGEWQTRLPLAIGVLGLGLCAFIFGRRHLSGEAGFYAALVLITAPGIFVYTRFLIPDVIVAMWLTLGLCFFLSAYEQEKPSRWVCWAFAATVALNVLTKSLIGIAFPGMILFVFLLLTGSMKKLLKMHPWSSALVFLIVAAPWHILAAIRSPAQPSGPEKGFLWFYFVNEQVLRYLNKRIPRDYDKVPLLLFWALLLVWLIPWFVFLFPALKEIPRRVRAWREGLDARARANLFLGVWAGVIMLFFSFSTRQEYYSIPVLPALALLIGGWLQRERESTLGSGERRAGKIASSVLLGIGVLGFAAAMTVLAMTHPFPPGTDIGDVLIPHPGQYALSLGHMEDLTIEAFGLFRTPLWLVGFALLIGTGLNWIFRRRGAPLRGNLALTGMMVVVLFCVHQGFVIFSPEVTSKNIALKIQKEYQPGDIIVINGKYEFGSTLNYYTGIQLHVLNGRDGNLWFGSFFPGAPAIFEDNESFARLWNGPNRVFLFTEDYLKDRALQGIDPQTVHVFARQGGKVVLTNHPATNSSAHFRPPSENGAGFVCARCEL